MPNQIKGSGPVLHGPPKVASAKIFFFEALQFKVELNLGDHLAIKFMAKPRVNGFRGGKLLFKDSTLIFKPVNPWIEEWHCLVEVGLIISPVFN